jgi:hypothetical protein
VDGTETRKQTKTLKIQRKNTIRKRLGKTKTTLIWNDNIKVDLIESACKVAVWIETFQDGVR